ncbi:MAG: MBL fold metallo-hydrolase [Actinobacteria bacterium]|nr:MBL fold metallo-hydrolase [Actinomycetota bacterium]
MRVVSPALLLLAACGPAIHVPPPERVARVERPGREVELCVLMQERAVRPIWQGCAEASLAPWQFAIASVLVKHPAGLVVLDPAFGRGIESDLQRAGVVSRLAFGEARTKKPLVDVLEAAGVDPADVRYALATHVHWDHVGALGDLPNARVLIARPELEFARPLRRGMETGVMPHHLKRAKRRTFAFDFTGPPVEAFASSFDFFGDGAVVAVPMPGHTPGSTAFLVRSAGKTWLFSGDTSWTSRGVELPAHKTVPVDSDREQLAGQLGLLHAYLQHRPDVVVVPAHDATALELLPPCAPGK